MDLFILSVALTKASNILKSGIDTGKRSCARSTTDRSSEDFAHVALEFFWRGGGR